METTPRSALAHRTLAQHVDWGRRLTHLFRGDPLSAARFAAAAGELELARALLSLAGGLLDAEEAQRVLSEAPAAVPATDELMVEMRQPQGKERLSSCTDTQREMYTRVLAGTLLTDGSAGWGQGSSEVPGLPGLWHLPALPERQRWAAGFRLLEALGGAAASRRGLRGPDAYGNAVRDDGDLQIHAQAGWASASWGGRWGLRHELHSNPVQSSAQGGASVEVVPLEHVMATLSASWTWDLPDLPALLSRPLLIEGLEGLPADRQALLTDMMADASALFGWTVVALPAFETSWPPHYQPLPTSMWASDIDAGPARLGRSAQLRPDLTDLTDLAQELRTQGGRNLVVLYSRASAARLCGLLPGSVLLSSSLCRAHLEDKMTQLAKRAGEPDLTVVATTLPSTPLGSFDRVYHLMAPLPHLIEAAQLSPAPLTLLQLRDVVLPQTWQRQSELTAQLMAGGDPIHDAEGQRRYAAQLHASEQGSRLGHWTKLRAEGQYAALTSELNAQSGSAVPVMIAYGEAGRAAVQRAKDQGWVSRKDLRYAAWATPTEAQRAERLGQAEAIGSGWAMFWRADYDDAYGLAWLLVQAEQGRSSE